VTDYDELGAQIAVQVRQWREEPMVFTTSKHADAMRLAYAASGATGRRFQVRRRRGLLALFWPGWVVREVTTPRTTSAMMALRDRGSNA